MKYVIVNIRDLICIAEMGLLSLLKKFKIRLYISDFAIANCCMEELKLISELIESDILKTEKLEGGEISKIYKEYKLEEVSITDIAAIYLCLKFKGILISNDGLLHTMVLNKYSVSIENIEYLKDNLKMRKAG